VIFRQFLHLPPAGSVARIRGQRDLVVDVVLARQPLHRDALHFLQRGGEEIESLRSEGVPFEIVPGITAANGVAAYAGIPLTHRDCAQACVIVTGHLKDGTMNLDWDGLARPRQTIVVYMGLLGLPVVCYELIRHGLAPETPAAVIERGTTPAQRVVTGTLASLPALANDAQLHPPTLIIIGKVLRLREKLAWFEQASAKTTPLAVAGT